MSELWKHCRGTCLMMEMEKKFNGAVHHEFLWRTDLMDTLAVWTGVVGAAVGGSISLLGTLIQARTTRREGQADRRHGVELAHQNFLIERRADAYVELLEHINLTIAAMHFQLAELGLEPLQPGVPPSGVTAEKWSKMVALVRAFASEFLRDSFHALHNTDVEVARIVATQVPKRGLRRLFH
jgi:hypothetical protein